MTTVDRAALREAFRERLHDYQPLEPIGDFGAMLDDAMAAVDRAATPAPEALTAQPDPSATLDVELLRRALRGVLPEHAIPAASAAITRAYEEAHRGWPSATLDVAEALSRMTVTQKADVLMAAHAIAKRRRAIAWCESCGYAHEADDPDCAALGADR